MKNDRPEPIMTTGWFDDQFKNRTKEKKIKSDFVEAIGSAIMEELNDRRGYRQLWDEIDDDIQSEIIKEIGTLAIKEYKRLNS